MSDKNGIGRIEDLVIDLGAEMRSRFNGVDTRLGRLETRMDAQDKVLRHVVEILAHKEDKK